MKRLALLLLVFAETATAAEPPRELDRVTVTADREVRRVDETVHAVRVVAADEIDLTGASHPTEIFTRVPGVWISRGSGQEHLTAIRSPVLTGAGACGAFLFLEDGIPVRPAGFCNVNQLFELNTEMADSLEVLRGPGSVLYGSNAMHGVVNVVHSPIRLPLNEIALTVGEYEQRRLAIDHADITLYGSRRVKYFGETAGSFQDSAGFDQHKLNLGWQGPVWRAHLAATSLDQDTAGYIVGEDAYRDPQLRHSNANPEAFRRADSVRAWAVVERASPWGDLTYRPYLRYSDMQFLQHYLPGTPLEENGHTSAGLITSLVKQNWRVGLDLEWAEGWLRETQAEAITDGAVFLQETRPAGVHYDFAVMQLAASPWLSMDHEFDRNTVLTAGLRADWIRYEYDNRMTAGNLRDDGSACGLGGCLFNRPADRSDTFAFASPKLGLTHGVADGLSVYGNLLRGFRVPQATELYRLQRGQDVADLEAETIDSIEAGLRGTNEDFDYDVALYAMLKRNVIFRDADGFNVSHGRTRHMGLEFDLEWRFAPAWQLAANGTLARHEYAFDYRPTTGEQFVSGREMDTAPRTLGSAFLRWQSPSWKFELEYQHVGTYYLDAENTQRYPGHGLVHVRTSLPFGRWVAQLRVTNLLDENYAERADYAFGSHRYFPGWPRRASITLAYTF